MMRRRKWIKRELIRLQNLSDRANEKGWRAEYSFYTFSTICGETVFPMVQWSSYLTTELSLTNCNKIVETDMGVSRTYPGNYSQYVASKSAWIEAQNLAWEKQQKEIEKTRDIVTRLGAGANAGRASTAERKLEKLQEEELIEKPFQRKQLKIRFPERGRSGKYVAQIKNLEFGFLGIRFCLKRQILQFSEVKNLLFLVQMDVVKVPYLNSLWVWRSPEEVK